MKEISEQLITSLAPNPSAVSNARKISQSGGFVRLNRTEDDTLYMGECKGSGKSNYVTSVDFVDPDAPVFRCSCPSRQIPCKHGLALLYEMAAKKEFAICELPEDIGSKRAKKEARQEKKQEKKAQPEKVNKGARAKKFKKQLEGLELTDKVIGELLEGGLGTLAGSSIKLYRDLARQLGDYYLPGPQIYIKRIALEAERLQEDGLQAHHAQAVRLLTQLHALTKKARVYLEGKLADDNLEDDNSILYEALGGIWQLERLQQLGLQKENVRLAQLSFDIYLDEARGEYVDLGYWADLDSGEIVSTYNYRPLKALKYVKQEDTVFDLLETPLLTCYPGDLNRRVRWEQAHFIPLAPEHLSQLRGKAYRELAPAVKAVKNQIKNTLSSNFAALMVAFKEIGKVDGAFVLQDCAGGTILLDDMPGTQQTVRRLSLLPERDMLTDQVIFGAFFYDEERRRVCLQPYSIVTEKAVIRLLY